MTKPTQPMPAASPEAVAAATGRPWKAWFAALDAAGAATMDHRAIVAWLRDEAGLQHLWWQQNVAVEYAKARGRRAVVGQAPNGTFQVGTRRTIAATADRAWAWLVERPGRDRWLGRTDAFRPEKGVRFATEEGVAGEVRAVRPGERLRLAWEPTDGSRRSTLQATVAPKGDRCTVGFHHEGLPDAAARRRMRDRWRSALDALEEDLGTG